jgi:hypothetical protein
MERGPLRQESLLHTAALIIHRRRPVGYRHWLGLGGYETPKRSPISEAYLELAPGLPPALVLATHLCREDAAHTSEMTDRTNHTDCWCV